MLTENKILIVALSFYQNYETFENKIFANIVIDMHTKRTIVVKDCHNGMIIQQKSETLWPFIGARPKSF